MIGTHPENSDIFDATGKIASTTSAGFFGRGLPGLVHWRGNGSANSDTLLLIGGYHGPINRIPWCEMYVAATNSWKRVADMNKPRGHLRSSCAITPDNLAFVPGGWDNTNQPGNSAELYDKIGNTWLLLADEMVEKRGGHITQVMPNGQFFILGLGKGAEFYDHTTGLFTWAGKVHGPGREQFNHADLADGSFLYVGGAGKIAEKLIP